jgi:hypothetical protein
MCVLFQDIFQEAYFFCLLHTYEIERPNGREVDKKRCTAHAPVEI